MRQYSHAIPRTYRGIAGGSVAVSGNNIYVDMEGAKHDYTFNDLADVTCNECGDGTFAVSLLTSTPGAVPYEVYFDDGRIAYELYSLLKRGPNPLEVHQQKRRGWLIGIAALFVLIVFGVILFGGNDGDSGYESIPATYDVAETALELSQSPFGEVQSIDQVNGLGEVIGTTGLVVVDKDLMADDHLVAFFQAYIHESGHNFFDIDFGDGTGYRFPGSRNLFSHQRWEEGTGVLPIGGFSGMILDDAVVINVDRTVQYMLDNDIAVADIVENPMLLIDHVVQRIASDTTNMYFTDDSFVVHVDSQLSERPVNPTWAAHTDATRIAEMLLAVPELDNYWTLLVVHFEEYGTLVFPQYLVYEDWATGFRLMDNLETERIAQEAINGIETPGSYQDERTDPSAILPVIEMFLADMDGMNYTLEFDADSNTIAVALWMYGLIHEFLLASGGSEQYIADWEGVVESMRFMSEAMKNLVDAAGHTDVSVMLNVLNDANLDNTLLMILNDTVIFDALN